MMGEQKREWVWLDWSVLGIRTVNSMLFILYFFSMQDQFNIPYFGVVLWIAAAYALPLLFWRPGKIHIIFFIFVEMILSGSLSLYFVYNVQEGSGYFIIAALTIGYLASRKMLYVAIPICVIALPMIAGFLLDLLQFFNLVASYAIALGVGICLQIIVSSNNKMKTLLAENEKKNEIITEQNKTLVQYAEQVQYLTLLEERSRMAKELHDTVGHTFTSTIMGLDAGIVLMDRDTDQVKVNLVQLRNMMENGLNEIRRNIHAMTEEEESITLSRQLERITSEFSKHTTTPIDFEMQGEEADIPIPGSKKIVMIRCLQESLTNAKRHGEATHIYVILRFSKEEITLTVKDNGIGSDGIQFGFGLQTMEERVSLMQGQLDVHSELGKGTVISCSIPLRK